MSAEVQMLEQSFTVCNQNAKPDRDTLLYYR